LPLLEAIAIDAPRPAERNGTLALCLSRSLALVLKPVSFATGAAEATQ
jgi:hypothetical protein